MMKKLAVMSALVALLALGARAEDWTITPGQGVGPIRLGMKLSEVEKPTKKLPQGKGPLSRMDTQNVYNKQKKTWVIGYTKYNGIEIQWDPVSIQIVVNKPTISVGGRTINLVGPGGLRVGGGQTSLETTLGKWDEARDLKPLKATTMYVYKAKGMHVIVKSGRIDSITIFPPVK